MGKVGSRAREGVGVGKPARLDWQEPCKQLSLRLAVLGKGRGSPCARSSELRHRHGSRMPREGILGGFGEGGRGRCCVREVGGSGEGLMCLGV